MRRLRAFALTTAISVAIGACVTPPETVPTSTSVAETTTSTTTADAPLGPCVRGDPKPGTASPSETIIDLYNRRDAESLVAILGGGRVRDPSLDPLGDGVFPDIGSWMTAAEIQSDVLRTYGYGFGEPFRLYVFRSNSTLSSRGIEGISVTMSFWVSQDCEYRVDSSASVSSPDACGYADEFLEGSRPECLGPFDPRANQTVEWTPEGLFVFGGTSGSEEGPLDTGFFLDPVTWTVAPVPPPPVRIEWWPIHRSVWTGDEVLVVGREVIDGRPSIFSYDPATTSWSVLAEFPEERSAIGAMVWTGAELIFLGGELNYADNTAWAFTPATGEWRQLPDPEIPVVEQIEGVWTGSEALFFGGYTVSGNALGIAFDPASETWSRLAEAPYRSIQRHSLIWTGENLIVASGHGSGPASSGHPDSLLIYHPSSDSWSHSSPMPISPSERGAVVWTGTELITWGGYATYGDHLVNGLGAAYDPVTDQWRVLPPAPLTPRCDHTGTWTGEVVVILGGFSVCGSPGGIGWTDGAVYDPGRDEWHLLEATSGWQFVGRLPDGTGYRIRIDDPIALEEATDISAALVVDLEGQSDAQEALGCTQPCPSPVIGITNFASEAIAEPSYVASLGLFQVPSGGWTMNVDLYENVKDLWGDEAERLLTESILPIAVAEGLPGFIVEPPLRWATDTEIPLQMQVVYESFVVRRGCGDLAIACSADQRVQVIPAEKVLSPAPSWDYDAQVTVEVLEQ